MGGHPYSDALVLTLYRWRTIKGKKKSVSSHKAGPKAKAWKVYLISPLYFLYLNPFNMIEKTRSWKDNRIRITYTVTRSGDFWTLGNFLKPLAPINMPKLLGNFCKGVKNLSFL